MKRLLILLIALCFIASMAFAAPSEEFIVSYSGSDDVQAFATYDSTPKMFDQSWIFDLDSKDAQEIIIIEKVGLATWGWQLKFEKSSYGSNNVVLEILQFGFLLKEEDRGTACFEKQNIDLSNNKWQYGFIGGEQYHFDGCGISLDLDWRVAPGEDILMSKFSVDNEIRRFILNIGAKGDLKTGLGELRATIENTNKIARTKDIKLDFLKIDEGVFVYSKPVYFDEEKTEIDRLLISDNKKLKYIISLHDTFSNQFEVLKVNELVDVSTLNQSSLYQLINSTSVTDISNTRKVMDSFGLADFWESLPSPSLLLQNPTVGIPVGIGKVLGKTGTSAVYDGKLLLDYDPTFVSLNELKINFIAYSEKSKISAIPNVDVTIDTSKLKKTDNLNFEIRLRSGKPLMNWIQEITGNNSISKADVLKTMVFKEKDGDEFPADFYFVGNNGVRIILEHGILQEEKTFELVMHLKNRQGKEVGKKVGLFIPKGAIVSTGQSATLTKKDPCVKAVKTPVNYGGETFAEVFDNMRKRLDLLFPSSDMLKPLRLLDNGEYANFVVEKEYNHPREWSFSYSLLFAPKSGTDEVPFSYNVYYDLKKGVWEIVYNRGAGSLVKKYTFTDAELDAGKPLLNDSPVEPEDSGVAGVTWLFSSVDNEVVGGQSAEDYFDNLRTSTSNKPISFTENSSESFVAALFFKDAFRENSGITMKVSLLLWDSKTDRRIPIFSQKKFDSQIPPGMLYTIELDGAGEYKGEEVIEHSYSKLPKGEYLVEYQIQVMLDNEITTQRGFAQNKLIISPTILYPREESTAPSPLTLAQTNDGTCVETTLTNIQTTIINTNETQVVVQVTAPTVTVTQATSPALTNETETIDVVLTNIPGLVTGQLDSTTGRVDSVEDMLGAVAGVVFSTGTVGAVAGITNASTGQVNYVTNAVPVITNAAPEVITNAVPVITNEMPEVVTNVIPVSSSNVCDVVATSSVPVVGVVFNDMTNACEALVSNNISITAVVTSAVPNAATNVVPDAYDITNSVPVVTNTVLGTVTNTPVATSNVCDVVATSSVPVVGVVFNDMTNACEVLVSNNIPVTAVVTSTVPNVVSNVTDTVSNKTYVVATTNGAIGVGETNVVIQLEPAISETGEVTVVEMTDITLDGMNKLSDLPIVVIGNQATQVLFDVVSSEGTLTQETYNVTVKGTIDAAELVFTNSAGEVRVDLPKLNQVEASVSAMNLFALTGDFTTLEVPIGHGIARISVNAAVTHDQRIVTLLGKDPNLKSNRVQAILGIVNKSSFSQMRENIVVDESVGMKLQQSVQKKISVFAAPKNMEEYFFDFYTKDKKWISVYNLVTVKPKLSDSETKGVRKDESRLLRIGDGLYVNPFARVMVDSLDTLGEAKTFSEIISYEFKDGKYRNLTSVLDMELIAASDTKWTNGDKVVFTFFTEYHNGLHLNSVPTTIEFEFVESENEFIYAYPNTRSVNELSIVPGVASMVLMPTDKADRDKSEFTLKFSTKDSEPKVDIISITPVIEEEE
jgi:hypothetical protein